MAIYRCAECENMVDNDYHPCEEFKGELICPDCAETHTCEWCGELGEYLHGTMHIHCLKDYRADKRADQISDERAENAGQ